MTGEGLQPVVRLWGQPRSSKSRAAGTSIRELSEDSIDRLQIGACFRGGGGGDGPMSCLRRGELVKENLDAIRTWRVRRSRGNTYAHAERTAQKTTSTVEDCGDPLI